MMFKTILTIAAAALAVTVSATYLYRRIKFKQLNKRNKDMFMRLAGLNNRNKKSAPIYGSDSIMLKKFDQDIKRWPKLKREPFPESPEALKAWREDNAWCNPDKPFNDALKTNKDAQLVLETIKKAKADKDGAQ